VLMDGMDGFEMCKKLKSDISTAHIPVIMLTAKVDLNSRLEGLSLGADDYINKPFNISELLLRVANKIEIQKKYRNYINNKLKLLSANHEAESTILEDKFLLKLYKSIDERLDDPTFGVEELASVLNMSRTSLHRKIKTLTNMTSNEIIKLYRLKKAVKMLEENFTISEVCYKTGFGSPSYFTKCFKEEYSLTPTEFLLKSKQIKLT
jgi:DNA-binding response OmpR family regulator